MPFVKGMKRLPGAGRKPGVPNKCNSAVSDLLDKMKCNPFVGMARIAMNPRYPVEVRLAAYSRLAPYVKPTLRSIQVSGSIKTGPDNADATANERIIQDLLSADDSGGASNAGAGEGGDQSPAS